jgi:Methyltransferase domain
MLHGLSKAIAVFRRRRELAPLISNWLFQVENRSQTFWGSVSEEDEKEIVELVKKANSLSGPIVEIGALFGFTTQLIATHKPTNKQLIAVENFSWNPFSISPDDHRVITKRVLRYNLVHCNTSIFDGTNRHFYNTYAGDKPAMVFIDAEHSYEGVKEDIDWAIEHGVPIISGHDYNSMHKEVMNAVDRAFENSITVKGSVWCHSTAM